MSCTNARVVSCFGWAMHLMNYCSKSVSIMRDCARGVAFQPSGSLTVLEAPKATSFRVRTINIFFRRSRTFVHHARGSAPISSPWQGRLHTRPFPARMKNLNLQGLCHCRRVSSSKAATSQSRGAPVRTSLKSSRGNTT